MKSVPTGGSQKSNMSLNLEQLCAQCEDFSKLAAAPVLYTVKFHANDIRDYVATAMQMAGINGSQYSYHPDGSTVKFTAAQLKEIIADLNDALKEEYMSEDHEHIKHVLDHIRQSFAEDPNMGQAASDSNDASPGFRISKVDPSIAIDQKEHMKKIMAIKLATAEIKKLAELVDTKYRTQNKATGLGKWFDLNYHMTMRSLNKAKSYLENASKGLDKFSLF